MYNIIDGAIMRMFGGQIGSDPLTVIRFTPTQRDAVDVSAISVSPLAVFFVIRSLAGRRN